MSSRMTSDRKVVPISSRVNETKPADLWEIDQKRKAALKKYVECRQLIGRIQNALFELKMQGMLETDPETLIAHGLRHLADKETEYRGELMQWEEKVFDLEEIHGISHDNTVYMTLQVERNPEGA